MLNILHRYNSYGISLIHTRKYCMVLMLVSLNIFRNLQMEYIDLYLIHWPISIKAGKSDIPIAKDDLLPLDFKSVWEAMEECQRLGLTKAIGVSNFSCKKLEILLSTAKIPPAVNQVIFQNFCNFFSQFISLWFSPWFCYLELVELLVLLDNFSFSCLQS